MIEEPAIYKNLSAFGNLKTKALLYGIPDAQIYDTLETIGLANTAKQKAGKFSLGMKQRLGVGMAILNNPNFLILDEPTNGLDPDGITDLIQVIRALGDRGITILVSSHQLAVISKIAQHLLILHDGKICYDGPNADLEQLEKTFFTRVHGGH